MIKAVNKSETSREDMILKHVNVDETKVCCEIGVLNGGFSEWIIGNLKPDILFLVDPWITYDNYDDANNSKQEEQDDRYSSVCEKFKDVNEVKIKRLKSESFLSSFENEFFDLIYIDGDHRFTGVLSDLILSSVRVKKGGYIVVDDVHVNENGSSAWPEILYAFQVFMSYYVNTDTSSWSSMPRFEYVDWCSNNVMLRRVS